MKADTREIIGLDILRFLAALLVMAYHLGFVAFVPGTATNAVVGPMASPASLRGFAEIGWVGVEIFFVISGFVIAFTAENATALSFVRSRVLRLAPCAWICASITLVVYAVAYGGLSKWLLKAWVHSVIFWPVPPFIDQVYWTLGIEIAFYSIVFALLLIKSFVLLETVMVVIGGISSILWFVAMGGELGISSFALLPALNTRESELLLATHGVYFALGVLLWSCLIKQKGGWRWPVAAIFAIAGAVQILLASKGYSLNQFEPSSKYLALLSTWYAALLLIILSVKANGWITHNFRSASFFSRRLGMATYPLYLLHNLAGAILLGFLMRLGVGSGASLTIVYAIVFLVTAFVVGLAEPVVRVRLKYLLNELEERYRARWSTRLPSVPSKTS